MKLSTNHQSTAEERNCYSEFPAYRLFIIIIIFIIIVIIIIIIIIIINILILLLSGLYIKKESHGVTNVLSSG